MSGFLIPFKFIYPIRVMPGSGMGNRFSGMEGCGILNQDFFLVGERPLWVVCGLTISAIERPFFHFNYYDNWAKRSSSWIWTGQLLYKLQKICRQYGQCWRDLM